MAKTVYTTLQTAAVATGNGSSADLQGASHIHVDIDGITTATVTFELSLDGSSWNVVALLSKADGTTLSSTAAADGAWSGDVRGGKFFRARVSAWVAGTLNVKAGVYTD